MAAAFIVVYVRNRSANIENEFDLFYMWGRPFLPGDLYARGSASRCDLYDLPRLAVEVFRV